MSRGEGVKATSLSPNKEFWKNQSGLLPEVRNLLVQDECSMPMVKRYFGVQIGCALNSPLVTQI